jgi:hypothetical protein
MELQLFHLGRKEGAGCLAIGLLMGSPARRVPPGAVHLPVYRLRLHSLSFHVATSGARLDRMRSGRHARMPGLGLGVG